jgi:hypothetical protein
MELGWSEPRVVGRFELACQVCERAAERERRGRTRI